MTHVGMWKKRLSSFSTIPPDASDDLILSGCAVFARNRDDKAFVDGLRREGACHQNAKLLARPGQAAGWLGARGAARNSPLRRDASPGETRKP